MSDRPAAPADDLPEEIATEGSAKIPAFSFPFKPSAFASAKKQGAQYPGSGKSNHDKTPGRAPNGTRRSMGKR